MKQNAKNILFYSLTSLTVMSAFNLAHADGTVTVPVLEGGMIVSAGTFYAIGSADNQDYASSVTVSSLKDIPDSLSPVSNDNNYNFGYEASIGYIFDNTANGLEASYRGLNSGNTETATGFLTISQFPIFESHDMTTENHLDYDYSDADLMLTQYLNLGHRLQLRLGAGAAYLGLNQEKRTAYVIPPAANLTKGSETTIHQKNISDYNGVGPRLGMDARYAIGKGFGFLGGVSAAFFIGSLDVKTKFAVEQKGQTTSDVFDQTDDRDNHDVLNLNGNIAVDYVRAIKNTRGTSVGLELGYRMDYYDNAVGSVEDIVVDTTQKVGPKTAAEPATGGLFVAGYNSQFYSAGFSGPYLDIKAAF